MKCLLFRTLVIGILAPIPAQAQQPISIPSNAHRVDVGSMTNGSYTNECLGFSLSLPTGFKTNDKFGGGDGKARHIPGGELALLEIERDTGMPFGNRIVLNASDANKYPGTVQTFVTNQVQAQISSDPQRRELVRPTFAVDYGGKHFFRADYKQNLSNGRELFLSSIYTKFRGYLIGETVMAGSPKELDNAAASLEGISFHEDHPDPSCIVGPDDAPMQMGVIGGVIHSTKPGTPLRVRIAEVISQAILIEKVPPQYPESARQSQIEGTVQLKVLIDEKGNVEGCTLVSGHPLLAPAAIDAVKRWKYKPYFLNGNPVAVETQATVPVQIPAR